MDNHGPFLRRLPLLLFLLTLVVALLFLIPYNRKPFIESIDKATAVSGDRIELTGRFFGSKAEGAKLIAGEQVLNSASIIAWENNHIVARVPRISGSILIKVKNHSGTSNSVVLGDASRFPQVEYGPWLPGSPFIEYIDPGTGGTGTLLTLLGNGFGERRGSGEVWVNSTDTTELLGGEMPDAGHYVKVAAFDLWGDSMLRFWVPPNVASGNIYVRRGNVFSNPIHLEVPPGPGTYQIGEKVYWSLQQEIAVKQIGAFPGNALYLRIPMPVENGLNQGDAVITEDSLEDGLLYRENSLDIYRVQELQTGQTWGFSRFINVFTAEVRITVNPAGLRPYDAAHPEIAASLAADEWIRPDMVSQAAVRAAGGAYSDWNKAQNIYNYVLSILNWSDNPPVQNIREYLVGGLADSEGYSFLFCSLARAARVPARPVGGILVDANGKTRRWWWTEFWIEGFGWVPADPALGDMEPDDGWTRKVKPAEYYFGGLDERHIAFSRGLMVSKPAQPAANYKTPGSFYSLQEVWEEVSGNLHSYKSFWTVPQIAAPQ
ncbi:MAG: hypothetical protein B0D92_01480 [Spirochaeta sp. LUC14_002_19_P3]|nr:MAG: hypothetical protein B0D92_01480 [Spirochaeta sp. LUC14_002_19_P3]